MCQALPMASVKLDLVRSIYGDREREVGDRAREYFDRHGRWPVSVEAQISQREAAAGDDRTGWLACDHDAAPAPA